MNVLGIYREEIFSPGKIQEDKQIMDKALAGISRFGIDTKALSPESIPEMCEAGLVLNMAQSEKSLSILKRWEENGTRVINSPGSIINCYRKNMVSLLKENGFPIPKSWIYDLEAIVEELFQIYSLGWLGTYWIKRGDFHAIEARDVVKVSSFKDMEEALIYFKEKRVPQIVIQEHRQGKIIKFYGVGDKYIKAFLLPDIKEFKLDPMVKDMILKAIRCLDLEVYGGDMIIEPSGNILLLDINDWPSFSLCQDEAAKEIAGYIKSIMEDSYELSSRSKKSG
ncbi:MAG: hypothetical protein DRG39_03595 [Deltaproteobacteria bacterium]|nr:MAG: hypothetical protein DRG39_03595 [Deltaproteobacteria bacterium]